MIRELVIQIEHWDLDTLIEMCQQFREAELARVSDEDIAALYNVEIGS